MGQGWQVRVYRGESLLHVTAVDGHLELGRQDEREVPLRLVRQDDAADWRLPVVGDEVAGVSRRHARVESLGAESVRLTNLSERLPIQFRSGEALLARASRDLTLPLEFALGPVAIQIDLVRAGDSVLQMLDPVSRSPAREGSSATVLHFPERLLATEETEALIRWVQAAQDVLQSAATSQDFYHKAARSLVDLVDLDSGRVLLREDGRWKLEAHATRGTGLPDDVRPASSRVLESLLREKRTCWQVPADVAGAGSLLDIEALVAAPLIDARGDVVGALYGDRVRSGPAGAAPKVSRMEARLVELLAGGLSAGMARVNQEREAVRARVQFEQFFSAELSRHLAVKPDLLVAREQTITALFCDVRGFSAVSERVGPALTMEWMGSILDAMSTHILAEGGVVVDYIGDEIFAMFGAPEERDDHADAACRAALRMLDAVGELDERWRSRIGGPTAVGIGIDTGAAQVGNTGSTRRFKYGALGSTVNRASRVQGANKYLKTRALFTESTRKSMRAPPPARRLCQVEVVNIKTPLSLYEILHGEGAAEASLVQRYEQALAAFEQRQARQAVKLLGSLLDEYPDDGPAVRLLSLAVQMLTDPDSAKPVWVLPGK